MWKQEINQEKSHLRELECPRLISLSLSRLLFMSEIQYNKNDSDFIVFFFLVATLPPQNMLSWIHSEL